ncbi:MAG TPA: metalloregulator ArsR/SmtB family transcription factor [Solirubrobacteraceae bacterium]|jgi:DNA-binding transcriptional ArsR family regulator|nr:metalloregulator ArsR/SmtB family transcription factor [Solirubrobacteraceae bacterium]
MAEYYLALDSTYGALAHPARRRLLEILRQGEARVTALADAFTVSLATTSKHIKVLEAAGLVTRTVNGRDHVIALQPARLAEASAWLDSYRMFWESRLDKFAEALEEKADARSTYPKEQ